MLQGMLVDDNMSNLTSAISNEASLSSSNTRNEMTSATTAATTSMYPQQLHHQSFASPSNPVAQPLAKKKRNLPGNPDPEAEVVALSPRSLLATNRFVCEICNKGFQRDQNLQLHRRGHNLPWKLKQRNKQEVVKKKVYVCPEPSCVHHDPSRALGDLTGIKKHFCRKHGEKKWKCDKCSKRYAVQSDWKAHSKICGTREYRCDCGTLFSRRDSFITHRAFCDALSEESSRSMTTTATAQNHQLLPSQTLPNYLQYQQHQPLIPLKQENNSFNNLLPPWLSSSDHHHHQTVVAGPGPSPPNHHAPLFLQEQNPNPNSNLSSTSQSLMSATALLQKAAQMGVTMSSTKLPLHHQNNSHVGAPGFCAKTAGLPSREEMFLHGLASFGDNKVGGNASVTAGCMDNINSISMVRSSGSGGGGFGDDHYHHGPLLGFDDSFNGMMSGGRKRSNAFLDQGGGGGGGGDGMTRDFLGLKPFPAHNRDFLNMAGFDQIGNSTTTSYDHHHQQQQQQQGADQNQAPWQS